MEVPVIDIWRIIASFDPLYSNYTNSPDPDTEIHVHDIWISVPSSLHRKALVHMDFRPEPHFTPYDRASVSTELFAIAMCGGTGLPADRLCDEVLYSSANAGWETIKVPIVFAFTLIPVQNRCYFEEQWDWITARAACMLDICFYLWDHAEAIDLDANGVPVKIILKEATALIVRSSSSIASFRDSACWRMRTLEGPIQIALRRFIALHDPTSAPIVEIEDAVELLMKAN